MEPNGGSVALNSVYEFYQSPVKATFSVWCLYSELVHAHDLQLYIGILVHCEIATYNYC
jgi:hypothetical protein